MRARRILSQRHVDGSVHEGAIFAGELLPWGAGLHTPLTRNRIGSLEVRSRPDMLENLDSGGDRIANDQHAGPGPRGGEGECCNLRGIVEQGLQLHGNYLVESGTACGFRTFAAVFRPRNARIRQATAPPGPEAVCHAGLACPVPSATPPAPAESAQCGRKQKRMSADCRDDGVKVPASDASYRHPTRALHP